MKASTGLLQGDSLEAETILDFFETTALLVRRGALDEELVWNTFFYWADRYFEACKQSIATRQTSDPLVWKDLTSFIANQGKFQTGQSGGKTYYPPDADEVVRFLREEQAEAIHP